MDLIIFLTLTGDGSKTPEQAAKFHALEKSMILNQFSGAASILTPKAECILKKSRTQQQGGKMAQKGDFSGLEISGTFSTKMK